MRRVCVFCGSGAGTSAHAESARALSRELARRGLALVYGGAKVGIMGVLAREAVAAGAEVIGVMPRALVEREVAYEELDDLRVVADMGERKAQMMAIADGFIALPGGFGTLDELFEVLVAAQLRWQDHPVGLLDPDGYFDGLLRFVERTIADGYVHAGHRELIIRESDPAALLDQMTSWTPPAVEKVLRLREKSGE